MNGGCMDTKLIVITNTDWLIDWWFLSAQSQLFHVYSGREKVQQYIKYTLKWVRDLPLGQPFVTVTGNAWWVRCGHKIKPFIVTTMRCHFLRNQQKGAQRARSIILAKYDPHFGSQSAVCIIAWHQPSPYRQDNNMGTQCAALWVRLWKPSQIPSNQ